MGRAHPAWRRLHQRAPSRVHPLTPSLTPHARRARLRHRGASTVSGSPSPVQELRRSRPHPTRMQASLPLARREECHCPVLSRAAPFTEVANTMNTSPQAALLRCRSLTARRRERAACRHSRHNHAATRTPRPDARPLGARPAPPALSAALRPRARAHGNSGIAGLSEAPAYSGLL